jgi:hypothetical protein
MAMSQWNTLHSYFKQINVFFFFKNGEQIGKTDPIWGLALVREGGYRQGKGIRGWTWWKYVHMYINGGMIPVETVPQMGA